MDRKILFLCILALSNVTIHTADRAVAVSTIQQTIRERYCISPVSSQNQVAELDPAVMGNPLPLDSSRSSTVGSPVRLSPVAAPISVEASTIRNLYGTNSSLSLEQKKSEFVCVTINCCPFCVLELATCEKTNCCCCCPCCSDETKDWFFSFCCMS